MQLNKGKRGTRASARNERRYYLSLPSTAFEYRSTRDAIFSLCALPSQKLSLTRPTGIPRFTATTPVQSVRCARGMCVCVTYASMHACANIPGSRYCNFKDRSGIADRYSDPKYRFRLRRSVPLIFTRMSSFRSTCVSSGGCTATSADLLRKAR